MVAGAPAACSSSTGTDQFQLPAVVRVVVKQRPQRFAGADRLLLALGGQLDQVIRGAPVRFFGERGGVPCGSVSVSAAGQRVLTAGQDDGTTASLHGEASGQDGGGITFRLSMSDEYHPPTHSATAHRSASKPASQPGDVHVLLTRSTWKHTGHMHM